MKSGLFYKIANNFFNILYENCLPVHRSSDKPGKGFREKNKPYKNLFLLSSFFPSIVDIVLQMLAFLKYQSSMFAVNFSKQKGRPLNELGNLCKKKLNLR